ncbi:MAG: glycosyltransferase family 4 protein [Capnocytophaga sp.]|nr:glycosyltransferase family 4 protein [Capnocytophaga sp.]
MSRKILIHSIVFSPDGVSTAYLYNDIALNFKKQGYDVVVLTTTPHYNVVQAEIDKQPLKKKLLGLYYESDFEGIKVKHIPQKKFKNTLLRIIGFLYWHIISFFLGIFERKIDVILSPSPPLTIGFLNILIGKIKSAKVIYNVQEIYPDLLIENSGLKSKPVISVLKWLERFVYNNSNAVTTIDKIFYDTIIPRFKDKSKLYIIPNFVDTDLYRPNATTEILNPSLFPESNSIKLMYAGNIGFAQDWETLIALAIKLREQAIDFFVIGEGVMKDFLWEKKKEYGLTRLHLLDYQPRNLMPSLLAYADIQFIFMSPETEGHGFPSKVYTIMACAKPMLVCSGETTPIINFLRNKECAYLVTEKNMDKKIDEIITILLHETTDKHEKKGLNGYVHITKDYTKKKVTTQYAELVENLFK